MSKGLEALKDLSKLVFIYGGVEQYKTIEEELKRLEELEKAFDALSKDDEKAKKLLSKEIEKNRAFEIIKNKRVDVAIFFENNNSSRHREPLTQEEYDLLKEVLL